MPAAVVKDGTVTPKFRQGKISPPFLTAKPPPPVALGHKRQEMPGQRCCLPRISVPDHPPYGDPKAGEKVEMVLPVAQSDFSPELEEEEAGGGGGVGPRGWGGSSLHRFYSNVSLGGGGGKNFPVWWGQCPLKSCAGHSRVCQVFAEAGVRAYRHSHRRRRLRVWEGGPGGGGGWMDG